MKYSIRQILIFIFILIGIAGIIFVVGISYVFYQFNINHIINHHITMLNTLANIIGGPFWTLQGPLYPGTEENILRETLSTPDVVFVRLIDVKNQTIEKSGNPNEIGKKIENIPFFKQEVAIRDNIFNNEPIKEFSIKARNGNNLWIGITFKEIKKQIFSVAITIGEIIAIFSIIIIIGIFLLVKKIIMKPLMELMDGLKNLQNKKYPTINQTKHPPVVEIQKTIQLFNLMSKKIKNTEEKLREDIERIKEVDRMKSEFVSLAAHQLRTPLSAIKWSLKMAIDGDLGKLTPEQKTFLLQTYQSNERMINLVNDFLNVVRIEEGRFGYNFSLSQLEDLIDVVVRDFINMLKEKKIKFTFNKPNPPLPKTMMDSSKMSLAIQNLIDNAIKYTPKEGNVTIDIKQNKMYLEVSIKDSGVGIPKEQQDNIFTKFFRGNNVIKMQTVGTGLGLFIAKNIIEKHGGKIWFESKEKQGTTFYFTIPFKNF